MKYSNFLKTQIPANPVRLTIVYCVIESSLKLINGLTRKMFKDLDTAEKYIEKKQFGRCEKNNNLS